MDLLDGAEDHRRGALDGLAHQVPWVVAVMYLGEPTFDPHGLAVRAGWATPGILEALIPGRMQGHDGTEEVPG